MTPEQNYQEILEHTRQMLEFARQQDWNALTAAGERQRALVESAAAHQRAIYGPEKQRLAATIAEIEKINAEIIERVQAWQQHVKILLRLNKPSASPAAASS